MNYKTVYDIGNNRFSAFYIFPFPFAAAFTALFIVSVFIHYFSFTWEVSFGLAAVSFMLWSLLNLFQMIADEQYIFKPYREHTCEEVEGVVSNFLPKSRTNANESFEVSGLLFLVPNASSKVGYSMFMRKNGVISGDGQNVRITYAFNKMLGNDMVIVKIETEQQ